MRKPPLRTPDGKPQLRSLDDILREAVNDEEMADLPGKGKPLDLTKYFAAGDARMANKLLKDNQVLPLHLQDRKDAETHANAATDLLEQTKTTLAERRQAIQEVAQSLVSSFPDRSSVLEKLGLESWPDCFPEPCNAPIKNLPELQERGEQLAQLITQYNARIKAFMHQYLEHLSHVQESVQNYQKQTLFTGGLTPVPSGLQEIYLSERETDIRTAFPFLPQFPEDFPQRLKFYLKEHRPSIWQRLF